MRIDLTHNKIIEQCASEGFMRGITEDVIPTLSEKYGSSLECVQMYEDYLSDNFLKDGFFYYPLTLVIAGIPNTVFVKWCVSCEENFENGNPYAYLGEKLEITVADDAPMAFRNALSGRSIYASPDSVKISVSAAHKDISVLSGKYSQTFIDEMAKQLTAAIEKSAGVRGLADSSIELTVFFAPDTYMEHTSENVTYRRLLISQKGSAPRDFWVKWTRLASSSAYSVRDSVCGSDVRFEIGEDVSHKIREKEYRFLVYNNPEKYRMAMGRKNITEWRELIKRAVKKGELMKSVNDYEDDKHVSEVSDKLSQILEKCGVSVPSINVAADIPDNTAEVDRALREAILGSGVTISEPAVSVAASDSGDDNEPFVPAEPDFVLSDEADDGGDADDVVEPTSVITIEKPEVVAVDEPADSEPEVPSEKSFELMLEIEVLEGKLREAEARCETLLAEKETSDERLNAAIEANRLHTEKIKEYADILEAMKLSADNDKSETVKLCDTISALTAERDALKAENALLGDKINELNGKLDLAREEARRSEEALREQLILDRKEREREKLLYAEAARLAREEADRLAREKSEREASERAERERAEAELAQREERERAEAERAAEIERIERQRREDAERRENALARAREIRLNMEAEAKRKIDEKYSRITDGDGAATEPQEEKPAPVPEIIEAEEPKAPEVPAAQDTARPAPAIDFSVEKDSFVPEVKEPEPEFKPEPKPPVYVSKEIRLLFIDPVDIRVTEKLRQLIGEVIKMRGKQSVYIKMKASLADATTVLLSVLEIPEDELQLLVDIINYVGNAGLGIYKVILE